MIVSSIYLLSNHACALLCQTSLSSYILQEISNVSYVVVFTPKQSCPKPIFDFMAV